jgi:salicylate hydroxylase
LRNDLRRLLYESAIASGAVIHFERRAKTVGLGGPFVTFEDGEVVGSDLLIGADGTNSKVRRATHPDVKAEVLDQCVFQALIPKEVMYKNEGTRELYEDPATHLWLGQNYFGLSSVVPARNVYDIQLIFVDHADRDDPNPRQLLEPLEEATFVNEKISGWNPVVRSLFKNAKRHLKWRIMELPRMGTAISKSGKVVLIGDSYHGMVPHAGKVGLFNLLRE